MSDKELHEYLIKSAEIAKQEYREALQKGLIEKPIADIEEELSQLQKENQHLREYLKQVSCQLQDLKERYYKNVIKNGNYFTPEEQNGINKFWEEAAKENYDINDLMNDLQTLNIDENNSI